MTTYFVDTAVGDDANAGTSEGAGNAWATIDKAANTVVAGDLVHVKASGNYNEEVFLDTAGTAASWIGFEGYTSTPGDGGQVTIDAQSTRTQCVTDGTIGSPAYYRFKNFRFTGATGDGFNVTSSTFIFHNCRFDNCAVHGVDCSAGWHFIDCQFDNNSEDGVNGFTATRCVGCTAFSNTDSGLDVSAYGLAYHCISYANASGATSEGQYVTGLYGLILNSTGDGENSATKLGLHVTSTPWLILNNIFFDCHIGSLINSNGYRGYEDFNAFLSNTTDVENHIDGLGPNSHTGDYDPFSDSASRDYTLDDILEEEVDAGRAFANAAAGVDMGAHQFSQVGGPSKHVGSGGGLVG